MLRLECIFNDMIEADFLRHTQALPAISRNWPGFAAPHPGSACDFPQSAAIFCATPRRALLKRPRSVPETSQMDSKKLQDSSGLIKIDLRQLQDDRKWFQDVPRWPQDAQRCSKMAPESPKMASQWPQHDPRWPQKYKKNEDEKCYQKMFFSLKLRRR